MLPDWLRGGVGGRLRSGGDHDARVGRGLETVSLSPLKAYVTTSPSLALAAGRRALSDLPTAPYPMDGLVEAHSPWQLDQDCGSVLHDSVPWKRNGRPPPRLIG